MAEEFVRAVEDGLRLSRRVYLGKDRAVAPPRPMSAMEKATHSYLPTAPMLYAVIENPAIVDNPDIPSYQPHVHGRCDPPSLIPLQMNSSSLDADCYLDTAFLTFTGSWRVHCVKGSKCCDCRIAIPMGEQGSIRSVEVEVPGGLYRTQLLAIDDKTESEKAAQFEDGSYLKPHIFTLKIPQIDGGTNLLVTISWSQKLSYNDGQFSLKIPFSFPEYVTPAAKKISKREKIKLNVNCGLGTQVLCRTTSHPLKELRRQAGRLGYLYEADVINWSSNDFVFTYSISSSQTFGGVLLQSPSTLDIDQREMFCCYLFPGIEQRKMVFRKEVVFVVDISGSMRGQPLEDTKSALFAALSKLDSQDAFSIIAFNDQTYLFSSSLELATKEAIENATQWINMNFVAGGGTNILNPLNQALEMFSNTSKAIPLIFLITDGAAEDERNICDVLKSHQTKNRTMSPRICTFGIGRFCNHYFLRMLAMLGRGFYDAAYDVDSIEARMENLFATASSIILANICIDFETLNLEDFEVYPYQIPDLSSGSPLVLSGRYCGVFPKNLEARGILADLSNFSVDLKVQEAKDIPLDKVLAKHQIDILTAQAWLTENKKLEEKIAKMSVQNAVASEYTRMTVIGTGRTKGTIDSTKTKKVHDPQNLEEPKQHKIIVLQNLGLGFGNLTATAENIRPGGSVESKPDAAELFVKAASNCCSMVCEKLCCMCCIQTCSKMNDQCSILMTQLLGSLACLGCFSCCELCCSGDEG
ncbi:PREDICTED: uncharacterized protein LOC109190713 [Ipomoea nil]|uniref:uncharacterized protein LOC109190713 n=1 Tax=Ipomoea nil TaxID=35883 RepID=UPI000901D89E|nr:PREDICTED: uncharacterized protein LOC109190713 [Ipomoea nil]